MTISYNYNARRTDTAFFDEILLWYHTYEYMIKLPTNDQWFIWSVQATGVEILKRVCAVRDYTASGPY